MLPLSEMNSLELHSLSSDAEFYNLEVLSNLVKRVIEIKSVPEGKKIYLIGGVNYKSAGQLNSMERYVYQYLF